MSQGGFEDIERVPVGEGEPANGASSTTDGEDAGSATGGATAAAKR